MPRRFFHLRNQRHSYSHTRFAFTGIAANVLLLTTGLTTVRAQQTPAPETVAPALAITPNVGGGAVTPAASAAAQTPQTTIIEPPLPILTPGDVSGSSTSGSSPSAPASSGASALVPPTTNSAAVGNAPPAGAPQLPASVGAETGSSRRFRYALRFSSTATYDDNLQLSTGQQGGGFYFSLEPAVTVGFGDIIGKSENYIRLDYSPSVFLFTEDSNFDSVQHVIRLDGGYQFARLTLNLSQDVQILDGSNLNVTSNTGAVVNRVNLDVSARTKVNVYVTRVAGNYFISDKTALGLVLQYSRNDYQTLLSSQTTTADFSVNYVYSPKVTAGLGVTVGYLNPDPPTPDQVFEQLTLRLSYQLTGKLSASGSFGLEDRQFSGSSGGSNLTPVFELGATYQPFDSTSLSLSASRRVLSSAVLGGQDYTTTNVTFSARQRFFQKVFLTATFGYENSSYFSTGSGVTANRSDNYFYVQTALDYSLTSHWTFGGFYTHRENDSTGSNAAFADNQVGLRVTLNY